MRRFLGTAWMPFLTCLVLAGVTAGAYAWLKPAGADVGNQQIVEVFTIIGWAAGPVVALLSLILICILNGLRRLFRIRRVGLLHPITILLGIGPWLVFAWILTDEPRFTPFARAAIDFVGRPLFWGALAATLWTIILSLPLFFPTKK